MQQGKHFLLPFHIHLLSSSAMSTFLSNSFAVVFSSCDHSIYSMCVLNRYVSTILTFFFFFLNLLFDLFSVNCCAYVPIFFRWRSFHFLSGFWEE